MIKYILTAALLCMGTQETHAEWTAKVEGPDVFGNTKVIAGTAGRSDSLVIQCDQKDDLYIAFLFRKKEFDKIPNVSADLLLQSEGGQPMKMSAMLRTWNDNYAGIVVVGRSAENVAVLRTIASALGKINVGAVVNGNQMSAAFGSQGSRSAMDKAIKSCKLDDLEKKS
jgi:hypothetical protein